MVEGNIMVVDAVKDFVAINKYIFGVFGKIATSQKLFSFNFLFLHRAFLYLYVDFIIGFVMLLFFSYKYIIDFTIPRYYIIFLFIFAIFNYIIFLLLKNCYLELKKEGEKEGVYIEV